MTVAALARRPSQVKFIELWLNLLRSDGSYKGWEKVKTTYVLNTTFTKTKKSVDTSNFDIAYYEDANVKMTLDNSDGFFNEGSGFFFNGYQNKTKVRINAGYYNDTQNAEYVVPFEGLMDDKQIEYSATDDTMRFSVMAYSYIFKQVKVPVNTINSGDTFSQALATILDIFEIKNVLTTGSISLGVDEEIDDGSWFNNKQAANAIAKLMLASNSVFKIVADTIYISARTESVEIKYRFYGKGAPNALVNTYKIDKVHNGKKRCITRIDLNNIFYEADQYYLDTYGSNLKKFDIGFITDADKQSRIAESIIEEFKVPKQELQITTDYIGDEVDLLDKVVIDSPGYFVGDTSIYGVGKYGTARYAIKRGGLTFDARVGYKVLKIEHDLKKYETKMTLRAIGTTESDQWLAISSTPIYGVTLYDSGINYS